VLTAKKRNRLGIGWSIDQLARRLTQTGFFLLFLYPWLVTIYANLSHQPAPTLTTWLLPWDPLLQGGQALFRNWIVLVVAGPLAILALTLLLGRAFCGWICPLGTSLDFVDWVFAWRRRKGRRSQGKFFSPVKNSRARYYVLVFILAGSILSLKPLSLIDPLVVFQRLITTLSSNSAAIQQPPLKVYLSIISIIFIIFSGLELWQPRFWCRNLCPLGAGLSLVSHFTLLKRKVGSKCNDCTVCRRSCRMNAIPQEPRRTEYGDCTFCLECESACPKAGISFSFSMPVFHLHAKNSRKGSLSVSDVEGKGTKHTSVPRLSRREVLGGAIAGLAGLVVTPLTGLDRKDVLIRPPGALPEEQFLRTCIACQECVRVCPTSGLRPAFLEGGLAAIGTPRLVPRQGGCALNPSCPDLCAQVCPTGALQEIRPDQLKLGLASVDHSLCLAWDQGARCLVCVEACLVKAARIYQGRIVINPQLCTGCGRCECGCPVAGSAIHVYPLPKI
jgi:polyferredoxin